jgi:diacylglycerol O-acyltransferase
MQVQILSALDATFIYLESEHSPMAIGGVYVFDAKEAPDSFSYDTWVTVVQDRLRCSKVFRERLVEVPWDLSFPYWIRDPDFDLQAHLPRKRLEAPGGMQELMGLAAEIWSNMLDRGRPLWEMTFVEGLDNISGISKGSCALITRVHHAAVDGKAGEEMMSALMDLSPEIRQMEGEDDWEPEEIPSRLDAITESWSKAGKKALGLPGFIGKTAMGAAHLFTDKRLRTLEPPPRILTAPTSIFNQPIRSRKSYWAKNFDFERIRAIRKAAPGVTINDIVLAICAGGLRNYLLEKDELPEKPLVAMAPISVRQESVEKGNDDGKGNQVSAMLLSLATDIDDPLERLLHIHQNTQRSKVHANALPANQLTEFLPSETLAAAARVYTRTRLGGRHRPFFNVTITNVPGPPVPLYIAGAKIHTAYGMAPILDGLGLILVVLSYRGRLSIGVNSSEQIVPDPEFLVNCIAGSLGDLEKAITQENVIDLPDSPKLDESHTSDRMAASTGAESLRQFRDASRELDKAIESLEALEK